MRLTVFIDSLVPAGAEISTVRMLPYLLDNGIAPNVVLHSNRPGLHDAVLKHGIPIDVLDGRSRPQKVVQARQLLRAQRPDVVHTVLFESDIVGRTAGRLLGIPVVSSWVSDNYGDHFMSDPSLPWFKVRAAREVDRWTCKCAAHFHSVSQPIADRMCERMRVPRRRVTVIPRSRDPEPVRDAEVEAQANRLRGEFALESGTRVLLAVGRHEWAKGYDVLLGALAHVSPADQWTVLVAGKEGRATPQLTRMVNDLDLSRRVRFIGARTDVRALMCLADLFVLTSRFEGFPNVVIEAMAAGLPVVASDIDVVREMVEPGVHAELFTSGDAADLATTLEAVMDDRGAADGRAARARERFLTHYSDPVVFPRYASLYRSVADAE